MAGKGVETEIWDLAIRVFHWSLVILVGFNLFLIEPRGGVQTVLHFVAGYAVAGLLLFRLAWGFLGSARSRFADFLRGWPAVRRYLARLLRFDPPHSVGHNPAGGWMIALLLATLAIMIVTGLFAASRRAAGPLAGVVPSALRGLAANLHVLVSNLLIAFIIVHVLGVVVDWFLTGDNLVKAMVTGRKRLSAELAAAEPGPAPVWRALVFAAISLVFAAWLSLATDYTQTRLTLQQTAGQP
jgi:cytochrome b